jgi:uncharacterized protein (DUF305 family)
VIALAGGAPLRASGPAPTQSQSTYEVRFMTSMIDHHSMAVIMGEMCLDKAVHEELRTLCSTIVATQTEEIQTMQSWLAIWYGISYAPQMTAGMQAQMDELAALSGAEFETMFLKMMIRHHWKAVVMGSACIDRAYHPELVSLCANIVEAQTAEITQMRAWLCQWYGICDYGPKGAVAATQ